MREGVMQHFSYIILDVKNVGCCDGLPSWNNRYGWIQRNAYLQRKVNLLIEWRKELIKKNLEKVTLPISTMVNM